MNFLNMVITDFYRKNKICVSKWTACLLEPLTMAIKVEADNMESELFINIPVGFYIDNYFSRNDFDSKAEEANILFSFLVRNKEQIKEEFGLTDQKYNLMLTKLEVILVKNYAICNWFRKTWKLVWAYVRLFESFLMGE